MFHVIKLGLLNNNNNNEATHYKITAKSSNMEMKYKYVTDINHRQTTDERLINYRQPTSAFQEIKRKNTLFLLKKKKK